jgi:VWFA-related protein
VSQLHKTARPHVLLLALLMLIGLSSSASAQQASSSDGNAVSLSFTAVDKKKQAVATLRKEDVRLTEDGVQQEITAFERKADQPLSIVVMLDTSMSQERVLPIAKQVSLELIASLPHPGADSIGVVSFTGEAKFEQDLTSDLEQVRQAIRGVKIILPTAYYPGPIITTKPVKVPQPAKGQMLPGSTAIWDALSFASEKLSAQGSTNHRRVIIIFTDGHDTSSQHKLNEAAEVAIKSGVVVYSIGLGDEYYGGIAEGPLRKISEQTGGHFFYPEKLKDLQSAFAEIGQELRSQYLVSYSPPARKADNKLRKLKIEIVNPELRKRGLRLSHQQGYYAKKG